MILDLKPGRKATKQQIWYIALIFDGLCYSNLQRRDYFKLRYNKSYSDELSISEASEVIEDLKERKLERKES